MKKHIVVMHVAIALVSCVPTVLLSGGCVAIDSGRRQENLTMLASRLRNADIVWRDTSFGSAAVLNSETAKTLYSFGDEAVPFLVATLTNNDQYVAGHVVLSKIYDLHEIAVGDVCNGLLIEERTDDRGRRYIACHRYGRWAVLNLWHGVLYGKPPTMGAIRAQPFCEVLCEFEHP